MAGSGPPGDGDSPGTRSCGAMTQPDDLQFVHGYPIPTRDHATLLASHQLLLDVARECLPVTVTPRGETTFFEDWEITRAAFMARMSGTLRHLSYLVPSYSRLDGFALARTLVDHVITFAWMSVDPNERQPAFLRDSFKNLLRKDARSVSRGDGPLLGDAERASLSAFVDESSRRCRASESARPRPTPTGSSRPGLAAGTPAHHRSGALLPRRLRPLLGLRPSDYNRAPGLRPPGEQSGRSDRRRRARA